MGKDNKTLQIQSVIYNNDKDSLCRAIRALKQAVTICKKKGLSMDVKLIYGDASSEPIFSESDIREINDLLQDAICFEYKVFGFNSGTARGHNIMAEQCEAEYMMIMNPDVILEPTCLLRMLEGLQTTGVAMVEARQTPLEHAKEYNQITGETEWASTACTIFTTESYKKVGGFDSDTFFLYCDDLDFSWRLRLAGYKIKYMPSAVVYHAKRLSANAKWMPTKAEMYYSAEAAILLAYKWSNDDRVNLLLKNFVKSGEENAVKAVGAFMKRKQQGNLPEQLDPEHKIAKFLGDEYCEMRFKLNG